jgi:hypothetical protein
MRCVAGASLWPFNCENAIVFYGLLALFPPGLYAGLQYRWASLPMLRNRPTKVLLKSLNLNAGSTQAGDLDDRAISWSKQGAFGQFKQIQILGCNIFAEVAGAHTKSLLTSLSSSACKRLTCRRFGRVGSLFTSKHASPCAHSDHLPRSRDRVCCGYQ